jgi:hypothetical protein
MLAIWRQRDTTHRGMALNNLQVGTRLHILDLGSVVIRAGDDRLPSVENATEYT